MMLVLSSIALAAAQPSVSSPEEDVVAAARAWLDAFEQRDVERFAELTHEEGTQFAIRMRPGSEGLGPLPNVDDIAALAEPGPQFREAFWSPEVRVRGAMAQFWAPYSFDIDGVRSHCGINSFTFILEDGAWKFANGAWTIEPVSECAKLGEPVAAAVGSTEEEQIIAVIDTFMRAINQADSDLKRSVMADEGYKVARSNREGRPPIWVRPFAEDYDWLDEHAEAKPFRETYWDPTILRHGDMALVWAPYSFDRNEKRTHCGVNAFNLMRVGGAWKITGVQYTAEPEGCPEGR